MPVPASINDLSTTAGSNSPPGSESPATLDDYLRAHAAFIAQLRDSGNTNAASIAAALAKNPNRLRNANFQINQRAVAGTVSLAAGAFGHDGWKAGASGCTYTFASSGGVVTLTISAGSLQQIIEGNNLRTGTHVLSWTGTAQGKIGAGSYSASGVTGSVTGGSNLTIEFNAGTLSLPQLEMGSTATPFQAKSIDEDFRECRRYTRLCGMGSFGQAASTTSIALAIVLDPPMRAAPTFNGVAGAGSSGLAKIGGASENFAGYGAASLGTNGGYIIVTGVYTVGERYIGLTNMALLTAEL